MPAIIGDENDVPYPEVEIPELPTAIVAPAPHAIAEGLILPSAVGPVELNDALWSYRSTAPTVKTLSPSAGAPNHVISG